MYLKEGKNKSEIRLKQWFKMKKENGKHCRRRLYIKNGYIKHNAK